MLKFRYWTKLSRRHFNSKKYTIDTLETNGLPEEYKNVINNDYLRFTDSVNNYDSLSLTSLEKQYILKNLSSKSIWCLKSFQNGESVNHNQLNEFFMKTYFSQADSLLTKGDTIGFHKIRSECVYLFYLSNPVYIRENSVCFFFYAAICNRDKGKTEFCCFKKNNGEWNKYKIFAHEYLY